MRHFLTSLSVLLALSYQFVLAEEPDYSDYHKALEAHVARGVVDYGALAKDKTFTNFLADLKGFDRSKLRTKNEKKAFYINLYNALTLELIVKNRPKKSIKDIWRPWAKKVYRNGGDSFSLDHIEHKILRPMGDYRIHFAINCASIGCPDLRSEPYQAAKLNKQLGEQMRIFLGNPRKGVKISADGKQAEVSKIFHWFKKDFGGKSGVLRLLRTRHPKGQRLERLKFKSYDWNLNGK